VRSVILDPWNGSGTTTTIARDLGYTARGYDLNPAMVVVAKARLLDRGVLASVDSIAKEILAEARRLPQTFLLPQDPLALWFDPRATTFLRALERGIQRVLVSYDEPVDAASPRVAGALSTLASFFYVCLFRTVRAYLSPFYATNPTWIKEPLSTRNRLRPEPSSITARFRLEVKTLTVQQKIAANGTVREPKGGPSLIDATIAVADSTHLPDADATVDVVLSSPPYCTRIDYAVATKAELAALGLLTSDRFRALRGSLLGCTALGSDQDIPKEREVWGRTCLRFMKLVRTHSSKASQTYYLRGFRRYFDGLHASLEEISRVLKPSGSVVIVVQDSFYKGERTNLQGIVREMGATLGWELQEQHDFQQPRTMAAVNPRSRKYRSVASATESVLFLRKKH